MSKHLGIFGSFHRIITSSNVSVSHSSAGMALCSVMCLPNDSSCQCLILTILAQPSTELCIRDPCSGPDFNLNSHLTHGPLHLIPSSILHSYNASCLSLVLGFSPPSKTGPWFLLYLGCSQFPSVDQHFGNPGLGAYPYIAIASKWDWISSTFPYDLKKNKQLVYIKSSAESFLHVFIKDVRPGASSVNVIEHWVHQK